MFDFFKKPFCTQCMNCGVDFSNHKKFVLTSTDGLIRRLDLDPVGWDGKDPNAQCRLVVICVLCWADYCKQNPSDEHYPDKKMINLCQSLHAEQHIIIPNGLPRTDSGTIIESRVTRAILKVGSRPKFKFITDTSINLENHKDIKINKQSYSYLRAPEVIRIRNAHNNANKMKLNQERLIKIEEELKKLGSGIHKVTLPNGGKYIGELKDGKPHGQGTSTERYLVKYPASIKDFADTSGTATYIGKFKNGVPHGQGTLFLPEGVARILDIDRWEGRFEYGEFQGDVLNLGDIKAGTQYRDE